MLYAQSGQKTQTPQSDPDAFYVDGDAVTACFTLFFWDSASREYRTLRIFDDPVAALTCLEILSRAGRAGVSTTVPALRMAGAAG